MIYNEFQGLREILNVSWHQTWKPLSTRFSVQYFYNYFGVASGSTGLLF